MARVAQESHRLDAVAVQIADEGGVIALIVFGPQPRRAVGLAARGNRRSMERIDRRRVRRAQGEMHAGAWRDGRHVGALVKPELGILLAEADGGIRPFAHARHAERRQQGVIEFRCGLKIAHRDGDVVDHTQFLSRRRARLHQLVDDRIHQRLE